MVTVSYFFTSFRRILFLYLLSIHTNDYLFVTMNICLKFDECIIFQTPREGAQTTIYCAVSPALVCTNGKYFAECQVSLSIL